MPLSEDNIKEIRAWATEDGCAIGGIYSQDGQLGSQLAMALCGEQDMPNILYVRTTELEARLLEQDLVQAIPEASEYVGVWMGDQDPQEVVLTTYSVLHNYLAAHTGKEQPMFQEPALVVFEHEVGISVEGLVTRDMLAVAASSLAENEEGPWIKILGLSYSSSPQEWLQHTCRLLGGPDEQISLEILVRSEAQDHAGSFMEATWDETGIKACAVEIARTMKKRLNVVVFSARPSFGILQDAVKGLDARGFTSLKDVFRYWPDVELSHESLQVFSRTGSTGQIISMPHDGYPCALPFERIGMVVIMPPGLRRVYNTKARICVKTELSLTQAQYRIESGLKSSGQAPPLVVCFIRDSQILPKSPDHFIIQEDEPLAGWLSVISAYPAWPIDQLPLIGALPGLTYSHDCLAQLQVMGLVEVGRDATGFALTQSGHTVMKSRGWLNNISLSGVSALSCVMTRLRGNVARSAVRLILLLEHYPAMVKTAARQDAVTGDQLRLMLQGMASSSTHGGPGRRHVDRGSLWAAWVVFEEAVFGMDISLGNFEEIFARPEILPKVENPPFSLIGSAVSGFAADLAEWEHNLQLAPLPRNDWAGFHLSDAEADSIQNIMARAYYPYLVDIPVQAEYLYSLQDPALSLYRSKSIVRSAGPMFNLYRDMWAENLDVGEQGSTRSTHLCAGISTSALALTDIGDEVTADAVMVLPYGTALAVDKNGVDRWAREKAGL